MGNHLTGGAQTKQKKDKGFREVNASKGSVFIVRGQGIK